MMTTKKTQSSSVRESRNMGEIAYNPVRIRRILSRKEDCREIMLIFHSISRFEVRNSAAWR